MRTTTNPRVTRKRAAAPGRGDSEPHVHFSLSKRAGEAIEAALTGLSMPQQRRVMSAIDRVAEESGEKVGLWVEKNVIANVNELLAFLTPQLAREGRWSDLRAIWAFLARLDVPIDHGRLATALEKDAGAEFGARYREAAGVRRSRVTKRSRTENRPRVRR